MELTDKQVELQIKIGRLIDRLSNGFEHPDITRRKLFELCDKNNADIAVVSDIVRAFEKWQTKYPLVNLETPEWQLKRFLSEYYR